MVGEYGKLLQVVAAVGLRFNRMLISDCEEFFNRTKNGRCLGDIPVNWSLYQFLFVSIFSVMNREKCEISEELLPYRKFFRV